MSEDDASTSNTPSKAMMVMLSPDGYYTYLNIPKARINDTDIDLDVVKRNYRKLSIRVSFFRRENVSFCCFKTGSFGRAASAKLLMNCSFLFHYFLLRSTTRINPVAMSTRSER